MKWCPFRQLSWWFAEGHSWGDWKRISFQKQDLQGNLSHLSSSRIYPKKLTSTSKTPLKNLHKDLPHRKPKDLLWNNLKTNNLSRLLHPQWRGDRLLLQAWKKHLFRAKWSESQQKLKLKSRLQREWNTIWMRLWRLLCSGDKTLSRSFFKVRLTAHLDKHTKLSVSALLARRSGTQRTFRHSRDFLVWLLLKR